MNSFIIILLFCSIVLCLPIFLILFFKNKKTNQLLAIAFFSIASYAFSQFLFLTQFILDVPIFYKIAKPLYLLIPPCIYLYVKSVLFNWKPNFDRIWWHFLPLIVSLIDMISWLRIADSDRYNIVHAILEDPANIYRYIPGTLHIWFYQAAIPIQGIIYLCYLIICLRISREENKEQIRDEQYKSFYRFAKVLTAMQATIYLSITGYTAILIMNYKNIPVLGSSIYFPALIMCTSLIFTTLYLYLHPSLLCKYSCRGNKNTLINKINYNFSLKNFSLKKEKSFDADSEIPAPLFSKEIVQSYQYILERELNENERFKQHGLSLRELAMHCNIPVRALSYIMRYVYNKHFNDFLNDYRIQYVVNRMIAVDWKELTLEGLAQDAGFASRTTFFIAFKKKKGMSPTLFLRSLSQKK